MNEDLKIILGRIDVLFKRAPHTRYWLNVVNDRYDHTYNLFFNSVRSSHRERSLPLHTLHGYQLDQLENLIETLIQHTKLTIVYTGFLNQRWPQSQRIIQRKAAPDEAR